MMEFSKARELLTDDLNEVAARTSSPFAALDQMTAEVREQLAAVQQHMRDTKAKTTLLPPKIKAEKTMLAKVDAIIAKAEAGGRADLKSAALARRAKHQTMYYELSNELDDVDDTLHAGVSWEERLKQRLNEVIAMRAALPGAAAAPVAVAAPLAVAVAVGADGEEIDPFAALMADIDPAEFAAMPTKSGALAAAAAAAAPDEMDDYGLPDLVEVGEEEMPDEDGDEVEMDIDFAALDALAGGAPAAAAFKGGKTKTKTKAKAKPSKAPATKSAASAKGGDPVVSGDTKPSGGSNLWRWLVLGVLLAGGGTLVVLYFLGYL
jgi:hypothetical protein